MRTQAFSLEIVALLVLILIPWPGPTVFKISCPRDSARVVRKLIQKKWLPVLEKRHVKLGLECPFHPSRDIFGTQQAAKQQHRPSQWACAFCGKSFYTERHLDQHFDSRHRDSINMAEDAVCLADYCDVMRCEVLAARESHSPGGSGTDIEVWRSSHQASYTALSVSGPRDLARVTAFPSLKVPPNQQSGTSSAPGGTSAQGGRNKHKPAQPQTPRCAPPPDGSSRDREGDANATADMCGGAAKEDTLVDSSVPPPPQPPQQQRLSEMQRFKANCKPEELSRLKTRCEILVRDCIAGLLVNLSVQDFKEIEEELNRASCWYLTCDRYWEDSPAEARASPWTLLALMGAMLAVGVVVCYYIIWVLFEPAPMPPTHAPTLHHHHHQQHHHHHHQQQQQQQQQQQHQQQQLQQQQRQHQASQPMMAPQSQHSHHHHHHYPVHPMHGSSPMSMSPSPHLSHASQMSHLQHLAQMPRGSPHPRQQEPNPFEREWRI